jgi:hypothetical protein
MFNKIAEEHKDIEYKFICDCGYNPSDVMVAFSLGMRYASFKGKKTLIDKLVGVAKSCGAELIGELV